MRRSDRAITDRRQILNLLDDCHICRLAMQDEEGLYVVPLNFGYDFPEDGPLTLYFHSAKQGRKIDALRNHPQVAFEMDLELGLVTGSLPCNYGYLFKSMIGQGEASFIDDPLEKQQALVHLMRQQTGLVFTFTQEMAQSVTVFQVQVSSFTAKGRLK